MCTRPVRPSTVPWLATYGADASPAYPHAWIEVYLGGRWHMFDPRNNDPRIGRILIARGRDAADVPLTLTFGPSTLVDFRVTTEEVMGPDF